MSRRTQQPIGLDVYPYAASSTVLMPELMDDQIRTLITWSEAVPETSGQDVGAIAQAWHYTQRGAAERLQPAGAVTSRWMKPMSSAFSAIPTA